ncbi:MAG: glycosyltransferase family 39 protein [Thermoleophilia bacterium]|nr:glycosyltransferase family 39 protein [Thermoleophilia bacterium]
MNNQTLNSGSRHSAPWILVLLVLFSLVIRVAVVLTRQMIAGDETVYARMAENLARGNGPLDMLGSPSTVFFLLLPIMIAGLSFIIDDIVVSGYAVAILFGSLLPVPTYLLGRDLAGERAGFMAAALVAAAPLTVQYSSRIYTEGVYAFFMLMAAWLVWRLLKQGRAADGAAAGLLVGLAYLANPAAVFYAVAFPVLLLAAALRSRLGILKMARGAALLLLVFFLLGLPYVLYLHGELGKWTYSGKTGYSNIAAAREGQRLATPEVEKETMALTGDGRSIVDMERLEESQDPVSFYLENPATGLKIFLGQIRIFYQEEFPKVMPLWLLPLLGLGLFSSGWDRNRAGAIGYTLLLAAPVLLIFMIDHRARFFVPFVPLGMIWVAQGWQRMEAWGRETAALSIGGRAGERLGHRIPAFLAAAVLLPTLILTLALAASESYSTEYREAGEWIKDNAGRDLRIMDREFSAAYYAGGTVVLIPYADYDRTTAYARFNEVDYLVIGRQALTAGRPELIRLLEEDEGSHPEWRLVHTVLKGADREVLVFELLPE